jgi:glycerol-3-phosphate O-acyltransferase
MLYRVRVGLVHDEQYAAIDTGSTVVFVMNHRSNMDYILVAFLAAERTTLSYAVGEWAKIWPLQMLIRAMGAFFVRRKSGNPLYRRVLERYIHMATREGVCQAVFLEGGLSRDGALRKPKLGLMDYMLRQFDLENDRDIVFIPVGINYDRTLEDRSLVRTLDPEAEKRSWWFVIRTTVGFIARSFFLMIISRWRRYGYAGVNFGSPVSIKNYCQTQGIDFSELKRENRFAAVEQLCTQLMSAIAGVIPILPLSILSTIFLHEKENWLDVDEIEQKTNELIRHLKDRGAPVLEIPRATRIHAIGDALDHLLLRNLIEYSGDRYRMAPQNNVILQYYANSIVHWKDRKSDV